MRFYLESKTQNLDSILPPIYRALTIDTWIPDGTKLRIKSNDTYYDLTIVSTELEYDPHAFSQPVSGIMYVIVHNT